MQVDQLPSYLLGSDTIPNYLRLWRIFGRSARNDAPNNSPVMIYEDGRPLPYPHSISKDIVTFGSGRFTRWDDGGGGSGVVFSSSDNSDPNKNGREYWAVVPGATKEELREWGSWSTSAQR